MYGPVGRAKVGCVRARRGTAIMGKTNFSWRGAARLGWVGLGRARFGMVWPFFGDVNILVVQADPGMALLVRVWPGVERFGEAWRGRVWFGDSF